MKARRSLGPLSLPLRSLQVASVCVVVIAVHEVPVIDNLAVSISDLAVHAGVVGRLHSAVVQQVTEKQAEVTPLLSTDRVHGVSDSSRGGGVTPHVAGGHNPDRRCGTLQGNSGGRVQWGRTAADDGGEHNHSVNVCS